MRGMRTRVTRRTAFVLLVFAAALVFVLSAAKTKSIDHIDVHDGFETTRLSKLWETSRFAPGAVTMQTNVVKAGQRAAQIVVHSRDMFEAGMGGDKDSER